MWAQVWTSLDNFAGHRFKVGTLPWSHHVLGEKVAKWSKEEIVLEVKLLEGGSPWGHSGHLHQILGLWNRPALLYRWESPAEGNLCSQYIWFFSLIWFSAENLNFTYSFSNVEDGKLFWAKTRHRCIDLNCFELVKTCQNPNLVTVALVSPGKWGHIEADATWSGMVAQVCQLNNWKM